MHCAASLFFTRHDEETSQSPPRTLAGSYRKNGPKGQGESRTFCGPLAGLACLGPDQTAFYGPDSRRRPIRHVKLTQDVLHMLLDCLHADR